MMPPRILVRARVCLLLLLCLGATASAPRARAFGDKDWKPIDPAHLSMKTPVVEPDADAEAIFWEVKVADEWSGDSPRTVLNHYVRIKIFTERGRESQSRVDILAPKVFGRETRIKDIAGRTIKPDGSIVELKKSDIFERTIVKTSGIRVKAKSFAMPAVEPGAIIEYRWREERGDQISFYDRLEFSRDIPVQFVKYYVKPLSTLRPGYSMRVQTFHGQTTPFQKEKDGFHSTTMTNVPAHREEPYMPPEYAVRPWMLVYYAESRQPSPQQFWGDYGRRVYESHKASMKVTDEIKQAAAEAVGDAATPEQKLDRLFAYVRAKVKNIHDPSAGLTDEQRDKMKANKTPADTLKRGAGDWHDIDMLFAALVTAAGFDARVAKVASRADNFFVPDFPDSYFLDWPRGTENIAVRVGEQWRFYDPGSTYVAPGMLRWQEEGQSALVSDPREPRFVQTPISGPEKSVERRTAQLKLSEDGTLEGDVRIEYTGHLGFDMKTNNDEDTPQEREEALRERFKRRAPSVEITDVKIENVTDPVKPFAYSFRVRIPGYATRTGKRLFIQPAFFQYGVGPFFPTSQRRHSVYFNYPWAEEDSVDIELPEGFALDNAESPAPFGSGDLSQYKPRLGVTKDGRKLVYHRQFFFSPRNGDGIILFPGTSYGNLKSFFDELHKRDNHTVSLKQGATTAAAGTNSN